MVNLRKLNLSFNKLTKVEGLSTLLLLEVLQLGKNLITNADMLQGPNPFSQLTELSLFINNIAKLPTNLSFA